MDDQEKHKHWMWRKQASKLLVDFVRTHPYFMGEDAWAFVQEQIGPPYTPNVKGSLFRAVLLTPTPKLALKVGTRKATTPSSHSHEFPVYKSLLCPAGNEMMSVQSEINLLKTKVYLREITVMDALQRAFELGATTMENGDGIV